VQEGSFVGVICTTEWAAINAAKALKVTWSQPATKMPVNSEEVFTYLKNTKSLRDQVTVNRGNPDAALAQASKTYEAAYRWPFQLHGMMGPSCAVADVGKEQTTIYTGTQGSFETRKAVAELLGVPEKNVRVLWREASGSYGRMGADDVAEDAALLSRAAGKPVRYSGCAMTNMPGNPKVRPSWIWPAPASTRRARSLPGILPTAVFL